MFMFERFFTTFQEEIRRGFGTHRAWKKMKFLIFLFTNDAVLEIIAYICS